MNTRRTNQAPHPAGQSPLAQKIRHLGKDGKIGSADMRRIVADVHRDGKVTEAERQTVDREIARFKDRFDDNVRGSSAAAFVQGAQDVYNHFRTTGFSDPRDRYSQRLPSSKGNAPNRVGHDKAHPKQGYHFPLDFSKGPVSVVDGTGRKRGAIESSTGVRINYGQKKFIRDEKTGDGQWYVYAYDFKMRGADGKEHHASGWIPQEAVKSETIRHMGNVEAPRAPAMQGGAYQITGGKSPKSLQAKYDGLSVRKGPVDDEGNQAATDYLKRSDGVVHLLYALPGEGGVATDTLIADGKTRFIRSDVPPAYVKVYKKGHEVPGKTMTFFYGCVESAGSRRYGWIAAEVLEKSHP
jgi:hypothetical protein